MPECKRWNDSSQTRDGNLLIVVSEKKCSHVFGIICNPCVRYGSRACGGGYSHLRTRLGLDSLVNREKTGKTSFLASSISSFTSTTRRYPQLLIVFPRKLTGKMKTETGRTYTVTGKKVAELALPERPATRSSPQRLHIELAQLLEPEERTLRASIRRTRKRISTANLTGLQTNPD